MDVTRRKALTAGALGALGTAGLAATAGTAQAATTAPDRPPQGAGRGAALIGPANGDTLHVASFNIRVDIGAPAGSDDSWTDRLPVLAEFLAVEQPTVLGVQEALYEQVKQVDAALPAHYDSIGLGRQGGSEDEFCSIHFDADRLEPLAFDHFWLSDTPHVIGSVTWGNAVVRMVSWVRMADRRTGVEFVVANTHFDHVSEYSRVRSAELLRDRVRDVAGDDPVLVLGDFNSPAGGGGAYDVLVDDGLVDTWNTGRRLTPEWGTFPNYGDPVDGGDRIDWILTGGDAVTREVALNPFRIDGRYPSDHLPVQALVDLGRA
ncbi:endonuclease [Saccharomonospora sp. CUA-673]|nr:endonuclease [Saccharomonospora sp. CUA-673]